MNKQELLNKISELNMECLWIDDTDYDPIELILVIHNKKMMKKMESALGNSLITDCNKKRLVIIKTFKEIGLNQWERGLYERGVSIAGKVYKPCEEDFIALCLHYVYVYAHRNYWLRQNLCEKLCEHFNKDSEQELVNIFAEYLDTYHYQIVIKNIVKLSDVLIDRMSWMRRLQMNISLFGMKIKREIPNRYLFFKGLFFHNSGEKRFVKEIVKEQVVSEKYSVINLKGQGSSGCTFVKDIDGNNSYFIKGNELEEYRSLANEIVVQRELLAKFPKEDWYLAMVQGDEKGKWIKFPFVSWPTLTKYLGTHKCREEQLKLFGDFLLSILDKMAVEDIVHNDLRCDNIMVSLSEENEIERFVLMDFGCASVRGSSPWKKKDFWGKFFAGHTCGNNGYSENVVDDAAAAFLTYCSIGGDKKDIIAQEIEKRIGRLFFVR